MADAYSGMKPLTGLACFVMGLLYFFFVSPLVLWTPNALIGFLWYRSLAKVETSRAVALFVPVATLASTIACCTLFPYRPLIGAGLWVAAAVFAAASVRILPRPSRADRG